MKTVLFLGNSHTYVNDVPHMVYELCQNGGQALQCDSITAGGHALHGFQLPTDPLAGELAAQLQQKHYDVIVLQEESTTPMTNEAAFVQAATALAERAAQHGATLLLYQTWGWENGTAGRSYAGMTRVVCAAYRRLAQRLHCPLARVGEAFDYVRTHAPHINPYSHDGSHASLAGSYLAACCLYRALFHADLRAITYTAGLPEHVAATLREACMQ